MNSFNLCNPDYPLSMENTLVEPCLVSDADIPSANGGINSEGYTYGELRHRPIIPELMSHVSNSTLKEFAEICNSRNSKEGFNMFKVAGEYCFWALRVGPTTKAPSLHEMKRLLSANPKTSAAVREHNVSAGMIREVTYDLIRTRIAERCDISYKEAASAIGNQLDCAPHEDISGYLFMVPNWAHKWFRHDGYVSYILHMING